MSLVPPRRIDRMVEHLTGLAETMAEAAYDNGRPAGLPGWDACSPRYRELCVADQLAALKALIEAGYRVERA